MGRSISTKVQVGLTRVCTAAQIHRAPYPFFAKPQHFVLPLASPSCVYQGIIVISSTDYAISVWHYNHGNENAVWRFSLHSRSAQILVSWVDHEEGFLVSGERFERARSSLYWRFHLLKLWTKGQRTKYKGHESALLRVHVAFVTSTCRC